MVPTANMPDIENWCGRDAAIARKEQMDRVPGP